MFTNTYLDLGFRGHGTVDMCRPMHALETFTFYGLYCLYVLGRTEYVNVSLHTLHSLL